MAGERIDEEYYLVKRIDARYVRETEYYPDGATKREYELREPVKVDKPYPQIAELLFGLMAIAFVVLSIAIVTTKPKTGTQNVSINSTLQVLPQNRGGIS